MATAYSNITTFSKLYQSTSSNQQDIKQVFNLSYGGNTVKFAYLGSTLVFDYRGTGYFNGVSYGSIYDENWIDSETYIFCYATGYASKITLDESTRKLNGIVNYDGVNLSVSNPEGNDVILTSYYLDNNARTNLTSSTTPSLHIPELPHSYEIQNTIHSYYSDISNKYVSYSYLYNNGVIGEKLAFKFFIPRRTYTCACQMYTSYYDSSTLRSGSTYNIYYNITTEFTFGTGIWNTTTPTGTKYKYEFIDSTSYATNVTEQEFNSYLNNNVYIRNVENNEQNPKESNIYVHDSGNKKAMYQYSAVHSYFNNDTYYYYGANKTLERYYGLDLNSYQQVNDYVTDLKVPNVHDRIHLTTPKLRLQPYILTQLNYCAEATASDNWPDIRAMFFIHRISTGDLYKLNYDELSSTDYINNNGLNQNWAQILYDNTNWLTWSNYKFRKAMPAHDTIVYIKETAITQNSVVIGKNYYLYETNSMSHILKNKPPVREFPTSEMLASLQTYPNNTYTTSSNKAWFNIFNTQNFITTAPIDSTNFLERGNFIEQDTPDIDGQNHLTQDYVLYGCTYTKDVYDINGNIVDTITGVGSGDYPYHYQNDQDYNKLPWEWHDEDVNIICVSYNANITYGNVEYNTYYDVDNNYSTKTATTPTTRYCTINEYVNGVKITAEISYFRHNLTVNHRYDRPLYDSHNHFCFRLNQRITNAT